MSVFTSLGILFLSGLIIASLKLIPGVFAIFYHYASGKYSARKVSDLSIFFIFGAEVFSAIIFLAINYIVSALIFTDIAFPNNIFLCVISGLLLALALAFLLFYFRRGRGSKLFISRRTAANLSQRAKSVKTRSDAFALGFTAGLPELIFTLPIYFIVNIYISQTFVAPSSCASLFIFFILVAVTPLFATYAYFRNGNNLANFARLRARNKNFFRFFTASLYLLLAITIIIFKVLS